MNKFIISLVLAIASILCCDCGNNTHSGTESTSSIPLTTNDTVITNQNRHPLSRSEALQMAEDYLQKNKIDISGLSLVATFPSNAQGTNSAWTFIWSPPNNTPIFDGQIFVYVHDDGSVSHSNGA